MKSCPFCGEPIQPAAVKCRFCGEWLDPSQRPAWSGPEIAVLTEHIAREVARQLAPPTATSDEPHARPPRRRSSTRDIPSDPPVNVVAPDDHGRAAGSVEFEPHTAEPSSTPAYEAPGPYPGLGAGHEHARTLGQPAPRGPRWKPGREDSEPKPAAPSWQPPLSEEPVHAEPEARATISDAVWQAPSWLRPEEPPAAKHSTAPPAWTPPPEPTPTWTAPATPPPSAAPVWTPPAAVEAPVWKPEPRPATPRIPELGLEPELAPATAPEDFVDGGFGDEFDDDEFDDEPVAPRTKAKSGAVRKAKPEQPEPKPAKPVERPKAKPPKHDDDDDDDDFDDDDDDDFDDDDDDDDDASMVGASTAGTASAAAVQPRKLPWIPIAAVASALVLLSAYVFRDALFGPQTDESSDEAGEVAQTEPVQPEPDKQPEPKPETVEEPIPEPPAIDPEELEAKLAEATNLVNRQKHADAGKILDEILAKAPKEARAMALLAISQLEKRKHQDALTTANDCVAIDPSQAQCWITIAVVEQQNNNLARALEGYRKYLELEPKGAYAKDAKGQADRLAAKVEG